VSRHAGVSIDDGPIISSALVTGMYEQPLKAGPIDVISSIRRVPARIARRVDRSHLSPRAATLQLNLGMRISTTRVQDTGRVLSL